MTATPTPPPAPKIAPSSAWHALAALSAFKRLALFPTRLRPRADERPRNDERERARRRRQIERETLRSRR